MPGLKNKKHELYGLRKEPGNKEQQPKLSRGGMIENKGISVCAATKTFVPSVSWLEPPAPVTDSRRSPPHAQQLDRGTTWPCAAFTATPLALPPVSRAPGESDELDSFSSDPGAR
jgi:hypothetical protein